MRVAASITFNRLPELRGQMRERASQTVRKTASDVAAGAKARTPPRVDTGAMMNGYVVESESDLTCVVFNSQEYHIYHELGTHKMPAHPMLVPAAEAVRPSFMVAMESLLK